MCVPLANHNKPSKSVTLRTVSKQRPARTLKELVRESNAQERS